jgi:hypothetical protein
MDHFNRGLKLPYCLNDRAGRSSVDIDSAYLPDGYHWFVITILVHIASFFWIWP